MAELKLTDAQFGWVLSAFAFGYALFQTPAGTLADRYGARRVLTAVVTLWSCFTGFTAFAWNFSALLIVRFLFGAGEAGAFPGMARAVYNWIPVHERGLIEGINFSASRLGAAITMPLLPLMIASLGWKVTFLALMAVGLIWTAVWWKWFRDEPFEMLSLPSTELSFILANRQDRIAVGPAPAQLPLGRILSSSNMWLMMGQYFASNFTFFFCLSWLFPYVQITYGLSYTQAGFYAMIPLLCGAAGDDDIAETRRPTKLPKPATQSTGSSPCSGPPKESIFPFTSRPPSIAVSGGASPCSRSPRWRTTSAISRTRRRSWTRLPRNPDQGHELLPRRGAVRRPQGEGDSSYPGQIIRPTCRSASGSRAAPRARKRTPLGCACSNPRPARGPAFPYRFSRPTSANRHRKGQGRLVPGKRGCRHVARAPGTLLCPHRWRIPGRQAPPRTLHFHPAGSDQRPALLQAGFDQLPERADLPGAGSEADHPHSPLRAQAGRVPDAGGLGDRPRIPRTCSGRWIRNTRSTAGKRSRERLHFDYAAGGFLPGARPAAKKTVLADQGMWNSRELQKKVDLVLLARFSSAGVVVDEDMEVLEIRGHVGPYLEFAPGKASLSLSKIACNAGLAVEVRAAIQEAKEKAEPVRKERVQIERDGEFRDIGLEVVPLELTGRRIFLVLFEELAQPSAPAPERPDPEETRQSPDRQTEDRNWLPPGSTCWS